MTAYNSSNAYNAAIAYNDAGAVTIILAPLQWHMNRLAGTLVNNVPTMDAQKAANVWAATPSPLDLVGALNYKYGITDRRQFIELQGILNALAGTSGLGENAAAARIVS